jgi:glycine hydroxymethyltransferase
MTLETSQVVDRLSYFERHGVGLPGRLNEIIAMQRGVIGSRIHLIASASYPFDSVLRAMAEPSFVLPAEGMPGERFLPGAAVMDEVESKGEELTLGLFGVSSGYRATLQPHSGTQANQVVFNSVLAPDDLVLRLRPADGGHISHTVLIARRHPTQGYGLAADGRIDYNDLRSQALRHRPRLIIVGGSSLPRSIDFSICAEIAQESGALLHADVSHTATFAAAGVHPSPFPFCDFVSFNSVKNLRGPNGGFLVYRETFDAEVRAAIFPGTQGGTNESNVLAKLAMLLEWSEKDIASYASTIIGNARTMGAVLIREGVPLVAGGTDSHLLLLDMRGMSRSGAAIERILEAAGVLANRNLVPGDPRSPSQTSGLRLGTANTAILGYEQGDLELLARLIAATIVADRHPDEDGIAYLVEKYQSHLIAPVW